MHANTRAFTRARFRRGVIRSSPGSGTVTGSALPSGCASIHTEGASQWGQTRATHFRISNDFSSGSLRYTTSRRWQKLHSINNLANAS
jgi:hypothetical protein